MEVNKFLTKQLGNSCLYQWVIMMTACGRKTYTANIIQNIASYSKLTLKYGMKNKPAVRNGHKNIKTKVCKRKCDLF